MMNVFLPYQISACRFYARGSFYQSGGAYGFRDQLQDCLSIVYSDPKAVRTHIIRCCAHQYEEGCVMHWWHTRLYGNVNRGTKTKCSDDLLWLPLVLADYLRKTDDYSLLSVEVNYISSPPLGKEAERYEQPVRSVIRESVYRHCLRALAWSEKEGKNGLIPMGSCDWNDAFSLVGEKGRGESVFSTLLFILSAKAFIPIMEYFGENETAAHYSEAVRRYSESIEKNAFIGDRYVRAFCDDGSILGKADSPECSVDILSPAFASLAGLDEKRVKTALSAAFSTLFDHRYMIMKLFDPPFDEGKTRVGYVRGYVAGIRENGGQYTHGALFGALGMLNAGMNEEALMILSGANPISRCASKTLSPLYKTEPYAVAADIYSGQYPGRGGWSWYTGAASWYYRIVLENVLGIRLSDGFSTISVFPKASFSATLRFGEKTLLLTASPEFDSLLYDGRPASFPHRIEKGEHSLSVPLKSE